jgi:polyisoprenyl-phosphate glycosyltransferase
VSNKTFQSLVLALNSSFEAPELLELNQQMVQDLGDFEMLIVASGETSAIAHEIEALIGESKFTNTRLIYAAGYPGQSAQSLLWVGIDSAIGDRIIALLSLPTNAESSKELLLSTGGVDGEFIYSPKNEAKNGLARSLANLVFRLIYKVFTGQKPEGSQVQALVLSRKLVNALHKTARPEISLRNVNSFSGFEIATRSISFKPQKEKFRLSESFGRAMEILFSASHSPLRSISFLAILGAGLNLIYSAYVVSVSLTQTVERGWTSMSLQISGMFFLISLLLAAISEFLIFLYRQNGRNSDTFVTREVSSRRVGLADELNIDARGA